MVFLLSPGCESLAASPKSLILISRFSVSSRFPNLRSRCMIICCWKSLMASAICLR